jgi:hypothetical protein
VGKAQSQRVSAKLGEMFEELNFWRREMEFKSGSIVEFGLYFFNKERCNIVKVSSFRDILSNKFIFVFDGALLP